jgi:glycosyltransferase involved in cell wall biosynthesis
MWRRIVDKLHWSFESLVIRDGTYFGFGWVFHEDEEIQDLRLVVRLENGEDQSIETVFGKPRDDVAAHFPEFGMALHSGYIFLGSCNHESKQLSNIFLSGMLVDGHIFELNIPQTSLTHLDSQQSTVEHAPATRLVALFKRGLRLLINGQFFSSYKKSNSCQLCIPKPVISYAEAIREKLSINEQKFVILVIDHDLGGGANLYREQLLAKKIKEGATVFIFSFHVINLSYVLMVRNERLNERLDISGYDFLLELAEQFKFKEIIYNTGVSFVHPEEIPRLIVKLKNKLNPRLTLLAHDFFMVCPSHCLLDDKGVFCQIPDTRQCQSCLTRNQQGFATLFQARDMVLWRALWGNVIELADEVITFSNDSLKLFQKAYPLLDLSRAVVIPHEIEHLQCEHVRPSYKATLRIGVVGQIGSHKGAKFVQELAQEIKGRDLDIQIVVIGAIESRCEQSIVRQTGPYQHEQLPALIESSGVNIMLFPSIWPETFSYVVQELIELDLPVACFDLGAPAERLRAYAKGLILYEPNASLVLDSLIDFHQRIYLYESSFVTI